MLRAPKDETPMPRWRNSLATRAWLIRLLVLPLALLALSVLTPPSPSAQMALR